MSGNRSGATRTGETVVFHGKIIGKPWEISRFLWENLRKTMGNNEVFMGKIIGKPWGNNEVFMGKS